MKLLKILALVVLLTSLDAQAAPTLHASTNITLNAGTPSGTFSPHASATMIVAAVSYPTPDAVHLTGLSIGGTAMTKLIGVSNFTNNEATAEIWWVANPGGSGLTVAITSASTWKDVGITFHSISGAGTPTVTNTDAHNAGTALSAAVSCVVGDLIIAAASSDRSGSAAGAWGNAFTSDLEAASANSFGRFVNSHKTAASTTETATVAVGGSSASFSAALVVAVIPSGGGGGGTVINPISGGGGAAARPVTFN